MPSTRASKFKELLNSTAAAALTSTIAAIVFFVKFYSDSAPPVIPTEQQLSVTLKALQANSREAVSLLERLQQDIATRTQTAQDMEAKLDDLRRQRTLLELNLEQRKALEALTRRNPSAREVLASSDFWVRGVLLGGIFFLLGVVFNIWRTRRAPQVFLPPEIQQQSARLEQIERGIAQLVHDRRLSPEEAKRLDSRSERYAAYYGGGRVEPILPPGYNVRSTEDDPENRR